MNPNNQPVQKDNATSSMYVGGNTLLFDSYGTYRSIADVFNAKQNENQMYVNTLDGFLRTDLAKVKSVIKSTKKEPMLRFSLINSCIEVSKNRRLLVNRDGALTWLKAFEVAEGDLLITPKSFRRITEKTSWKEHISVPYESFATSPPKPIHRLVAIVNDESHEVTMLEGFHLGRLYYLVGLLDACGWTDSANSAVHLRSGDWNVIMAFCQTISSLFLVEPEISGDKTSGFFANVTNRIAADILACAMKHLFVQKNEFLGFYLSGFLDGAGKVNDNPKGSSIVFYSTDEKQRQRIKKSLHAFGILTVKPTKSYLSVDCFDDIQQFVVVTDCLLKIHRDVFSSIMEKSEGKESSHIGYILGTMLTRDRLYFKMAKSDFDVPPAKLSRYENGGIVPTERAWDIAESISEKIDPSAGLPLTGGVTPLITSDIVGTKVISIEDIGEQDAYDLLFDEHGNSYNHGLRNYFGSDILSCD